MAGTGDVLISALGGFEGKPKENQSLFVWGGHLAIWSRTFGLVFPEVTTNEAPMILAFRVPDNRLLMI